MAGVQYYTVFGQKVGAHILAAITLVSTGGAGWYFSRPKAGSTGPAINAKSKEEESFVQNFLKKNDSKH